MRDFVFVRLCCACFVVVVFSVVSCVCVMLWLVCKFGCFVLVLCFAGSADLRVFRFWVSGMSL